MAIWLEIHCDTPPAIRERCESDRNIQPGAMAMGPASAQKAVTAEAREKGWKRINGVGWACKNCQRQIALARKSGAL